MAPRPSRTPAPVQASFAPWAATFNQLTKSYVRLPAKRTANPWRLSPSGKSARGGFERPAQILLRCRSIFGVAARADVVTALVCTPRSGWTAAELAARVHLAKRVIANAPSDLECGGILRSTAVGNRLRYDLVERNRLVDLVGLTPQRMPAWSGILPFMAEAAQLVEDSPGRNQTALLVDAQHLIEAFLAGLARLGRVHDAPAFASWPELSQWLADQLALVASGRSPWLDLDAPIAAGPRAHRRRS